MASIIYLIGVLSSRRKRRRKNSFSFQRREEEKSTSNIYIYIYSIKKKKRKNYVCNFNKTYPSSIYISVSFLSCLRVESTISCLRTNTIINQKRWLRARKIFFLAQHFYRHACSQVCRSISRLHPLRPPWLTTCSYCIALPRGMALPHITARLNLSTVTFLNLVATTLMKHTF